MDPAKRAMLRVVLLADDREGTADSVERLMGTKAEARFCLHLRQGGIRQRGSAGRVSAPDVLRRYLGIHRCKTPDFTELSDFHRLSAIAVSERVCFPGNSILGRSVYRSDTFWGIGALRSLPVTRSGPNAKLLRN